MKTNATVTRRAKKTVTAKSRVRIILVGDSTVTEENGWGLGFKENLAPEVECLNEAANGRSTKSYRDDGRWAKVLELKGDYILVQFGHNDQPGKGPDRETDPDTTYRENMTRFVDEARNAGAEPILVTSIARRCFDKEGVHHPEPVLTRYVDVVKQVAQEKKVPLLDMQSRTLELYAKLGEPGCNELSHVKDGKVDTTHLNAKGGRLVGALVIRELHKAVATLRPYLKTPVDPR